MIIVHEEFIAHAQFCESMAAKIHLVQVISKMQLRKCKKGKPLYSMRANMASHSARYNNSMAYCSVLVHVLFSAMLSCSFSPVDRIHPWRARKSSRQGARDVPIHENLFAGCYFARASLFGNPRPLEFLT